MEKGINLMPEDIQRMIGKDAQRNNILAAKMVAEVVKTTLGPKGMDKMLVSPTDEIIVTNDGVTILEEMQIEHPAAKMMVEIARTQENEVGDGTTTAVMFAGKLLENAEKLLDKKIHPTVITKGYNMAKEKSQEILKNISLQIGDENENILRQIAMTAMTGKCAESSKEDFAEILVTAVKQIEENSNVDLSNIKIEKIKKDGMEETELISGVVINREKTSKEMPLIVREAKIALFDFPIEVKNPEIQTRISVSSPEQLKSFLVQEEVTIKENVEKICQTGANVIFCQKGIDDFAQYLFAKRGIYAVRRVPRSDMENISRATGAKIVSNLGEIGGSLLGYSQTVEELKHGNEVMTYIKGCKNPKSITILIHGGTMHVIDEIERALKDGLGDILSSIKTGLVVVGGGAVEMEIAKQLREYSLSLNGRERLAVEEFASALEFIPSTLAENAGLDPIEVITELKSKHDLGEKFFGLNLFTNKVENLFEAKILEPYKIKSQAIDSATEVATMILRIDDVIASKPTKKGMNFEGNPMNSGII